MPPRFCCCADCLVGEDNFDRADSNPPTGNWSVEGGEWEIENDELSNVSAGPIITTVIPPAPVEVGARYTSRIVVDLVMPASGDTEFGVICAYTSGSVYAWIKFSYNGTTGELSPTFYSDATTVVMDTTTHPGEDIWFCSPGTKYTFVICASDVEWTATNLGSGIVWHTCHPIGLDTLAIGLGAVGFLMGRFDNWEYYVHWESDKSCNRCECFCINPSDSDDYSCIPECLTLTVTRDDFDLECCIDDMVLELHLSNPDVSGATPVFNPSAQRKRWYSDIFECPGASSGKQWFVLSCDTDRPLALSLLDYPNTDPTDAGAEPVFMDARVLPDTVSCNPILLEYFGVLQGTVTTCDILDEFGTPIGTGTKVGVCDGCWPDGTEPQPTWSVTITECTLYPDYMYVGSDLWDFWTSSNIFSLITNLGA